MNRLLFHVEHMCYQCFAASVLIVSTTKSKVKMAKSKKTGISPRLPNDKLTPSQRFHDPDATGPTPETIMRAAERLGRPVFCDIRTRKVMMDGNTQAASSALGILRERGWLSEGQYRAGNLYGYYFRVVYGRITPKASAMSRWIGPSDGEHGPIKTQNDVDEIAAECRVAYDIGEAVLKHHSRPEIHRKMVRLVCLEGIMPSSDREVRALVSGLTNLMLTWAIRTG